MIQPAQTSTFKPVWSNEDKARISELFTALCEMHGKKVSTALVSLYIKMLEALPAVMAIGALETAIVTSKFFPKPVELFELAQGAPEERALHAWNALMNAIEQVGAHNSVLFEDTRLSYMVDFFGGWQAVCAWSAKELPRIRHEFIRGYVAAKHVPPAKRHIGIIEHQNELGGFRAFIPPTYQISFAGERKELPRLTPPPPALKLPPPREMKPAEGNPLFEELSQAIVKLAKNGDAQHEDRGN